MDLRELRAFVSVFEQRHLSRAAQMLNVSQSAVSFHIGKLEDEFGTVLFERKARGMRPTASGEKLYSHVQPLMRALQNVGNEMRERPGELSGEIAVGLAHSAMKVIGRGLIRNVVQGRPGVRLSVVEGIPGTTLLSVLKSGTDFALVFNPLDHPDIKRRPVLRERLVCIGRDDIIGTSDAPIELVDLLALPLVFFRRLGALLDDTSLLRQIDARARLRVNSVQAITGALLDGFGCTIGTRMYFDDQLKKGSLRTRPIAGPPIERKLFLCELLDNPSTVLTETSGALLITLVTEAVRKGEWDATLTPLRELA